MRRLVAMLGVTAVLAAACTGGETVDDSTAEPAGDGTATTEEVETTTEEATVGQEPGPGVDGDTVKVVFLQAQSACAETPEGQEPNQEFVDKAQRLMDSYVQFMNEEVLDEAGWQIDYEVIDTGGQFCPEVQSAAARQIVQEIQPFAVIGDSASPQGPIIADAVTAEGIIHIGASWSTYEQLEERAPYAWVSEALPMRGLDALMTFIDKRVLGTQVEDRSGDGGEVDRVWGIVAQDDEIGQSFVDLAETRFAEMGIESAGTYTFPNDPGTAGQQATTRITQMVDDGVNTVLWAADNSSAEAQWAVTAAMAEQDFRPDILYGTGGLAFLESFQEQTVWENAYGVSVTPLVALYHGVEMVDGAVETIEELQGVPENEDGYTRVWQEHFDNADDPQAGAVPAGYTIWSGLSHLVVGLQHVEGDVLNADAYARSMDTSAYGDSPNRCSVGILMGRDEDHASNVSWSTDHNGGLTQFTTIQWVHEPREDVGVQGRYESFDNFQYFPEPEDLPDEATHDTAELGLDIQKEEPLGLAPWLDCSDFPNYPEP